MSVTLNPPSPHPGPLIIGIAGLARHGKDSVADWLEREHGCLRLAFADALRDMLDALPIAAAYTCGDGKERVIPWLKQPYRKLLQTLGTDWGRQLVSQNLWVDILAQRIAATGDAFDRIVISDVRFPNEATWVRLHGHLWHVFRPGQMPIPRAGHVSEAGIEARPHEVLIMNNGGLEHLHAQVDMEYQDLISRQRGGRRGAAA